MMDDELQVLGTERTKKKYNKVAIAVIALAVVIAIVGGLFYVTSTKQPEKIETGKKIGDATILPELQKATDSLLTATLKKYDGLQGQAIVMEVQTGEILAMVGLERNFKGEYQPCKNFAHQQEPGTLMHAVSLLAVLETGKMKLSDMVDARQGVIDVGTDDYLKDRNWREGGYGEITLGRALEVGSNIGIGEAVFKIFGNKQQDYFDMLNKMNFGQLEGIEGIDTLKPSRYNSSKDSDWTKPRLWWSAIGYERIMSPIQMLTFYNAIANDGKMVKPTLKTGVVEIINQQIASKANIDSMQVALERVVSNGVGRKAGTPLLHVAGGVGHSEVECLFYPNVMEEYQLSFCGYFPAFEPKYSIIVSMNKLGFPASAGMVTPVFRQITEWMITHDMLTKERK